MKVTVSVPYFGVGKSVRRAVESILNQTYTDVQVVVVNDGDPNPPWQYLDHINDSRLVRFDLPENRGRYFADAVVFEACRPELWAIQDADDWSEPDRFELLVPLAKRFGAAVAPSWNMVAGRRRVKREGYDVEAVPDRLLSSRGYLASVTSGDRIVAAGGFHPGFRVGFDVYLANMVKLIGPWSAVERELYTRVVRAGSLTRSPETGGRSLVRREARTLRSAMYRRASQLHGDGLPPALAVSETVPAVLAGEVSVYAERLRGML